MALFTPEELAGFAEFDNCTVTITSPGGTTTDIRGARIPGAPVVIVDSVGAQEWELSAEEKQGLTAEQMRARKKVRLDAYYANITHKMSCLIDGVTHNILSASHDGSKSVSILLVERVNI